MKLVVGDLVLAIRYRVRDQGLANLAGAYDERSSENPSTFEGLKVDFPIVKLRSDVKDVGTVLFGLEEELELAVRFGSVNALSPERLIERRAGSRLETAHGLAKFELK